MSRRTVEPLLTVQHALVKSSRRILELVWVDHHFGEVQSERSPNPDLLVNSAHRREDARDTPPHDPRELIRSVLLVQQLIMSGKRTVEKVVEVSGRRVENAMALVTAPYAAAISRLAHLRRRPSRMKTEIPGAVAVFSLQIDECPMGEDEMIVIDDILGLKLPVSLVPRDKWL